MAHVKTFTSHIDKLPCDIIERIGKLALGHRDLVCCARCQLLLLYERVQPVSLPNTRVSYAIASEAAAVCTKDGTVRYAPLVERGTVRQSAAHDVLTLQRRSGELLTPGQQVRYLEYGEILYDNMPTILMEANAFTRVGGNMPFCMRCVGYMRFAFNRWVSNARPPQ